MPRPTPGRDPLPRVRCGAQGWSWRRYPWPLPGDRRQRQDRQHRLDPAARRLEEWRQYERLAEMCRILIDREPRPVGGELEQHSTRFLEIHRLEPEAIDHRRRAATMRDDLVPHFKLMRIIVHAPREMVHAADTPSSAALTRRLTNIDDAGCVRELVACPAILGADPLETERVLQEGLGGRCVAFPDACTEQSAHLMFDIDRTLLPGLERTAAVVFNQRQFEPVGIDQRQRLVAEAVLDRLNDHAIFLETRTPEREAALGNLELYLVGQSMTEDRRRELLPWEKREIGAGMPDSVGIEQVVSSGVILVDALLHKPHSKYACVEVEVLLSVPRNRSDVMEPVCCAHALSIRRVHARCLVVRCAAERHSQEATRSRD